MDPAERVFMYLPNHVCVYLFIIILLRAQHLSMQSQDPAVPLCTTRSPGD